MSYEVIARRWRPQDFTGLVGQDHVRTTLLNALKNDRLHHALLLTGPRGTGKTSTARILAKALRCPNAVDFVPCNQCSECEEITNGRSVNVVEIDGASNNGVDAIRELRDTVGYLPSSGKFKMYIIDEVHMLSTSAFNALLKTLEEPPGHVYFVMATTEAHKIPNTILSRCQRFDFRRIPTRTIAAHLQLICERDGVTFDAESLWVIARQGDGSMRDSQSLLDQVINFTGSNLKRELVVATLGLTDRGLLNDLLSSICAGDITKVVELLKGLHQSGGDPKLLLLDLMEQLRNTLLLKLSSNTALVDLPDSEKETLLQMAQGLAGEDLHLLFDMALKGAQDLSKASDTLLVLEMVLMRMTTAPRISFTQTAARASVSTGPGTGRGAGAESAGPARLTPSAMRPAGSASAAQSPPRPPISATATVTASGTVPATDPATASATAPAAPRSPEPLDSARPLKTTTQSPLELRFKELVERIKEVNGLIGAQMENCFLVSLNGKTATLGVSGKHKFLFDKMNQPDFKKKVLNYMNSYWGPGHQLEVTLTEQGQQAVVSPKALQEKSAEDEKAAVRKAVEEHPLVQSMQSVFKTEIKSIKETPGERK